MTPSDAAKVERILVPLDGSKPSWNALHLAIQMARAFHAEMTVIHVLPLQEFPTLIAEAGGGNEDRGQLLLGEAAKIARLEGLVIKVQLKKGRIADQVLRTASAYRPSLIVMGTRGLSGAKSILLGSVSHAVSHQARTTVVLVR